MNQSKVIETDVAKLSIKTKKYLRPGMQYVGAYKSNEQKGS